MDLAEEIWELILRRLTQSERVIARLTCKTWNRLFLQTTIYLVKVGQGFAKLIDRDGRFTSVQAQLDWFRVISLLQSMPRLNRLYLLAAPHHCLSDLRTLRALRVLHFEGVPVSQPNQIQIRDLDAAPLSVMSLQILQLGLYRLRGPFAMPHAQTLSLVMASASLSCVHSLHTLEHLKLCDNGLTADDSALQGMLASPPQQ